MQKKPLVVAFVANLMFADKIEKACRRLEFDVTWIETAEEFGPLDEPATGRIYGEPLTGRLAGLMEKLTRLLPDLLIFDLDNAHIPWEQWLPVIKSVPATRRIPAICFGPHVDVERLKAAEGRGADVVMARSRFFRELDTILAGHARKTDFQALQDDCEGGLSPTALKGLELFQAGEYFEAHEELELAWNEETGPAKELYRAVLQVAVAYLQIERGNYNGAMKMFLRLRQWITPLPDRCRGIDVERLRQDSEAVYQELVAGGPEGIHHPRLRALMRPAIWQQN